MEKPKSIGVFIKTRVDSGNELFLDQPCILLSRRKQTGLIQPNTSVCILLALLGAAHETENIVR
jgi:hypothetical protein